MPLDAATLKRAMPGLPDARRASARPALQRDDRGRDHQRTEGRLLPGPADCNRSSEVELLGLGWAARASAEPSVPCGSKEPSQVARRLGGTRLDAATLVRAMPGLDASKAKAIRRYCPT